MNNNSLVLGTRIPYPVDDCFHLVCQGERVILHWVSYCIMRCDVNGFSSQQGTASENK